MAVSKKMGSMKSVKVAYLSLVHYFVLMFQNLVTPVFKLLVQHFSALYPDPFRLCNVLFRTSNTCNYACDSFKSLEFRLIIKYLFRSHGVRSFLPT